VTRKSEGKGRSELGFEQALVRLEEIARKLESGDLPLEEAIALAEEGMDLSRLCEERLTAAEAKIQQLVEPAAGEETEEGEAR